MERTSEKELRALLHILINAVPSLLIYVDRSCRVVFWNDNASEMSAIETVAAKGHEVSEFLPFLKSSVAAIQRAIETEQVQRERCVRTNGAGVARAFEITVQPLGMEDGGGARGAVILVDVLPDGDSPNDTVYKTARWATPAGITEQMAHEINNHLAGIIQNVQVIRHRLVGDLPKNRSLAEACGTTLQALRAYIEKRDILPMIEAILDAGTRATRAMKPELRVERTDDFQ